MRTLSHSGDALEDVKSDEEIVLLGVAQSDAAWSLLITPVPDLAALTCNLVVLRDEETYCLVDHARGARSLNGMIDDAKRQTAARRGERQEGTR